MNRFQKFVARVCKIVPFDIDKALRRQYQDGHTNGYNLGRKEPTDCLSCPLYQQAQKPPSPNTDPALLARLEALKRKQDMMAFLHLDDSRELPKMPGDLTRKFNTQKLSEL